MNDVVNPGMPQHVAIVMDGNGRWAQGRGKERSAGHKAGVTAVETIVEAAVQRNIKALTLFAFSSENWLRPEKEVSLLMSLLLWVLKNKLKRLHKNNVHLTVIGDRSELSAKLQQQILEGERLTGKNTGLKLVIAINYGGQWDLLQATRAIAKEVEAGKLSSDAIDKECFSSYLSLAGFIAPDLFIRTGGDQRISNFLLWDLAYSELYFTDTLWPDFDAAALDKAIDDFARRQRRFGMTGEQVVPAKPELA